VQRKNSLDLGIVEENDVFEDKTRSFSGKKSAERKFSNLFKIAENVLDKDAICDISDDTSDAIPSPFQGSILNTHLLYCPFSFLLSLFYG
jgi:hypothetical protein